MAQKYSASNRQLHADRFARLAAKDARAITQTNDPQNPVVDVLQNQLANAIIQFLNYQSCAWQAEGIAAYHLRTTFAQFGEELKTMFDRLGKRLRMIGQDPEVQLEYIIQKGTVRQTSPKVAFADMIAEMDANAIVMIFEIRQAIKALSESSDDPGSVALLVSLVERYEEHEWFLRQLLKPAESVMHSSGALKSRLALL